MTTEVYVANLGKYNEGELVGEWLVMPATKEEMENVFEAIELGEQHEEYAIHDINLPEALQGLKVSEYENLHKLNELMEELQNFDADLVGALIRNYSFDLEEAMQEIEEGNTNYLYLDDSIADEDERLAHAFIDSIGSLQDAVTNLEYYFNCEAFGRDLRIGGDLDFMLEGLDEEEQEPYYNMSDIELADWYTYEILGSVEELGSETLERYFDYKKYGRDLAYDYTIDTATNIATFNF